MSEGKTPRPYEPDDMFRSRHVLDAALSPDASFAVYQLSELLPGKTKDEDAQTSALWRVDLAGGNPRRLTAKGKNATSPRLTPDGQFALFLSARGADGKTAQIYRLPIEGGEAEGVTSLEQGVSSFALSPDGEWIVFTALENAPKEKGPNDHVRISRSAYRTDTVPGYLQDVPQAIYLMPAKGGEHKRLTPHDGIVSAMSWSPDSREIAAVIMGKEKQDTNWAILSELGVIDREGHQRKLRGGIWVFGLFWTADGRQIGYVSAPPGGSLASQPQVFLIDRNGGEPIARTPTLDLAVSGMVVANSPERNAATHLQLTPDGSRLIVPVNKGGDTGLWEVTLPGPESSRPIIEGPRTCRIFARAGNTLLFSAQDFNHPSELYALDLGTRRERRLTDNNAEFLAGITWPDVEHVMVESAPGVTIEGWVLKPKNAKPPFKTVLWIHGGPHAAFGYSFNEDFQRLVGAGYAVAFCNPRGSTGYGDAFAGAIIGIWGNPEFADFNAFLDELVKRGVSDPNRLGVTGVSGGGHLSAWMIGHTDRFKAAVPEQGVYNMFSMYGTSDAGIELISLEMGGHPHEQGATQRYWDLSPIAHAHKCTTPTLLIQGENDIRCPMEQAEQFFTILKHNGCKAELLRLQNCNHSREVTGLPPLRRYRMDAMQDWFDRHVT